MEKSTFNDIEEKAEKEKKQSFYCHFFLTAFWTALALLFFIVWISLGESNVTLIISIIFALLAGLHYFLYKKNTPQSYIDKKNEYKEKQIELEENRKFNTRYYGWHISGLPNIPQNSCCNIKVNQDCSIYITESTFNQGFKLSSNSIVNIGILNENEIIETYKNKGGMLGKVIIGDLLLGPIGSFMGIAHANQISKEQKIKNIETLVINYKKEGAVNTIMIRLEDSNIELLYSAIRYVKGLRKRAGNV